MPHSPFRNMPSRAEDWPKLDFNAWEDSCATLHMWTQIVGKIRLACSPWTNHSWHVALFVTARGVTSSSIFHGARPFQIDFDFIEHKLIIQTGDGAVRTMTLRPCTVAAFHEELLSLLAEVGIDVQINTTPNEIADAIPFERDDVHKSYDAEHVNRFFRALAQADRVFKDFRSRFIGKCSPVHFFWGSFDLAVTRFSGRKAPIHPGGVPNLPDWVAREAYSHEVISCGFWPGSAALPYPAFYAYAYPEPEGFCTKSLCDGRAVYDQTLREFILPYEEVRKASSPDALLLDFLQASYDVAADLGCWDRQSLERSCDDARLP
jgi:hypothetical protein